MRKHARPARLKFSVPYRSLRASIDYTVHREFAFHDGERRGRGNCRTYRSQSVSPFFKSASPSQERATYAPYGSQKKKKKRKEKKKEFSRGMLDITMIDRYKSVRNIKLRCFTSPA